jgi:hypothetical protein
MTKGLAALLVLIAAPAFAEVTILRGTPAPPPPVVHEPPPPPPPPVVIYQPVPYPQPFYVLPMWWQQFQQPSHGTGRVGIAR